jgi:hypothetical protein
MRAASIRQGLSCGSIGDWGGMRDGWEAKAKSNDTSDKKLGKKD